MNFQNQSVFETTATALREKSKLRPAPGPAGRC